MQAESIKTIPREAITGIGTGVLLMAVFTVIWATIANAGLNGSDHHLVLAGFGTLAALFLVAALSVYGRAKDFPEATSVADIAMRKKSGKWFGIIFGAEGLGIFIAINVVVNLGHPELTIPVI